MESANIATRAVTPHMLTYTVSTVYTGSRNKRGQRSKPRRNVEHHPPYIHNVLSYFAERQTDSRWLSHDLLIGGNNKDHWQGDTLWRGFWVWPAFLPSAPIVLRIFYAIFSPEAWHPVWKVLEFSSTFLSPVSPKITVHCLSSQTSLAPSPALDLLSTKMYKTDITYSVKYRDCSQI